MYDLLIRGGTVVDGSGAPTYVADVAIAENRIVDIGRISAPAARIISADGALVTPGWIDIHTHYDGQVTWDEDLEGSAANGVTTLVMGNCGVGFAPVRPGDEGSLVDLMEGVEDIPGSALSEGMPWGDWESFPQYLDVLARRVYSVDICAQVPHGALRHYVLGGRAVDNIDASGEDLGRMEDLVAEAIAAGAVGFSTSRIAGHRSRSGKPVPGTYAAEKELQALARGIKRGGGGVFQAIPSNEAHRPPGVDRDLYNVRDEVRLFGRLSREAGLAVTFTTMQYTEDRDGWRDVLAVAEEENQLGARLYPQVGARGVGTLTTLDSYHMFMRRPTYLELANLDREERVLAMRRPEIRRRILEEHHEPDVVSPGSMANFMPPFFARNLGFTFPLTTALGYEPAMSDSIAACGMRAGLTPEEYMYDFLLEAGGTTFAYFIAMNYADGNLDPCREMLASEKTVLGLSDAGAHVNFQCDMSNPTFLLTHWVRDRIRGERLPLEAMVAKNSYRNAILYGMHDRGVLRPGMRADINVIDMERLSLLPPEIRQDLPAGGSRILQRAVGYVATVVAGKVAREGDEDTGLREGRLLRLGGRSGSDHFVPQPTET